MGGGAGQRRRTAGRRPSLTRYIDPARAAGRPGGVRAFLRQYRQAEGRRAVAPQPARRRSKRLSRRRFPVRRDDPGLSADRLGRRFRRHHGRRHRASLHHQHSRAAGNGAAQSARNCSHLLSGGAAQLGQSLDRDPGSHGGFVAAEEIHLPVLHDGSPFGRTAKARRRRAELKGAAAQSARRVAGLRTDQGSVRPGAHARRLHRRRGHGRGYVRVLPRARHQAAAALRPDRKQRLQRDPEHGRSPAAYRRTAAARASRFRSARAAKS